MQKHLVAALAVVGCSSGYFLNQALVADDHVKQVGCNCNSGHHVAHSFASPYVAAVPIHAAPIAMNSAPIGEFVADGAIISSDIAPPPGTLGQTYNRPSRPVSAKKHPRVGIIDINAPGATRMRVLSTNPYKLQDGLDGFRDMHNPNLWRFESKPLLPGVPHIFIVRASFPGPDGHEVTRDQTVRLIMGRVVTLNF